MYGDMKNKGHTTMSKPKFPSMHHKAPPSRTLKPQGKAIRMHHGENWTESVGGQKAGLVSAGAARRRRTMENKGEGTGLSGGSGKHIKIPKVNRSGHYPLYNEARGY